MWQRCYWRACDKLSTRVLSKKHSVRSVTSRADPGGAELHSLLSWYSSGNFSRFRNLSGWEIFFPQHFLAKLGWAFNKCLVQLREFISVQDWVLCLTSTLPAPGRDLMAAIPLPVLGYLIQKNPNFTHCSFIHLNLAPSANSNLMPQEILWE